MPGDGDFIFAGSPDVVTTAMPNDTPTKCPELSLKIFTFHNICAYS